MKLLFFLLFILLPFYSNAKNFTFHLEGEYQLSSAADEIHYILEWNQEGADIEGIYREQENNIQVPVTGDVDHMDITFKGTLPTSRYKFMTIETVNVKGENSLEVPVEYTFRDDQNVSVHLSGDAKLEKTTD